MKSIAFAVAVTICTAATAHAESCTRSRDYLLGGLGSDLMQPPQTYQSLFKRCMATIAMSNVKDAFILNDGGIAVYPKIDTVSATAATLSAFCDAFPRGTLRFLNRKDQQMATSTGRIVQLSSTGSTTCRTIKGLQ